MQFGNITFFIKIFRDNSWQQFLVFFEIFLTIVFRMSSEKKAFSITKNFAFNLMNFPIQVSGFLFFFSGYKDSNPIIWKGYESTQQVLSIELHIMYILWYLTFWVGSKWVCFTQKKSPNPKFLRYFFETINKIMAYFTIRKYKKTLIKAKKQSVQFFLTKANK